MSPRPKLTMERADIQSAMAYEFKKEIQNLEFEPKAIVFTRVDPDGECSLRLDGNYIAAGDYSFTGDAMLCSKNQFTNEICQRYAISGRVNITEVDESPLVKFISKITYHKK